MKLVAIISSISILSLAAIFGQSYFESDYNYNESSYNEEAYYQGAPYNPQEGTNNESNYTQMQASPINNNHVQPIRATPASFRQSPTNGDIVMHPVKDAQTGMVTIQVPLPSNWKVSAQGWQGPAGEAVQEQTGETFNLIQRPIRSIDQVIQSIISPKMQQSGLQTGRIIDLPQVARHDQQFQSQLWSAMPAQKSYSAKGVEYQDRQGNRGMVVVHFTLSQSQYGSLSFYFLHVLQAPASRYETAKKHTLYALSNFQPNPQFIDQYNQREQQKSNASWATHNDKMRRNQQYFDSWNKTHVNTMNEINDMSMKGWRDRNASSDRMQQMEVNAINGETTIQDPYNGNGVNVQDGYKYYYINQFGEYMGTNDEFYNPERDPNVNNLEWRKVENPGGGY
jgi:hypothetical protein